MNEPKKSSNLIIYVLVAIGLGFVLIVCCGILAAVAIPGFIGYLTASKTAEAEHQLTAIYRGAEGYYAEEHFAQRSVVATGGGPITTRCAVESAITNNVPGPHKTVLSDLPVSFAEIDWYPTDPLYYQYEIVSVGGCGHPAGTEVYRFIAHGDLDGDGVQSRYEFAARATADGTLERDTVITRTDELE